MAVIREDVEMNGNHFVKNHSDAGMYIERDGIRYIEALDPMPWAEDRIYNETDEPIDK